MLEARKVLAVCIGIDIHKKYSYAAVVDETGEIKEEVKTENTKESLEQFAMKYQGARAVIEASNTGSSMTS